MYRLIEEKEVLLYGDEYWNEAAHHWFLLWSSAFGTLHDGSILIRRKISQDNIKSANSAEASKPNSTKATICPHYGKEIVNRYTGESEIIHHCRSEGKL